MVLHLLVKFALCFFLLLDACLKFAIDAGVEIVILFENRYEIYGDIRGAKNCFGFDAYEQGQLQ